MHKTRRRFGMCTKGEESEAARKYFDSQFLFIMTSHCVYVDFYVQTFFAIRCAKELKAEVESQKKRKIKWEFFMQLRVVDDDMFCQRRSAK